MFSAQNWMMNNPLVKRVGKIVKKKYASISNESIYSI